MPQTSLIQKNVATIEEHHLCSHDHGLFAELRLPFAFDTTGPLVQPSLTIKYDDRENGEVEEYPWPG